MTPATIPAIQVVSPNALHVQASITVQYASLHTTRQCKMHFSDYL
jgi:hypothetical protein